jgi:trehalose/maltose transport system substrate-binding protein
VFRKKSVLIGALLTVAVALVASFSVASAGTTAPKATSATTATTAVLPKVPNAAAIKKKYGGTTISTYVYGAVGAGKTQARTQFARFTKDTGIKIKWVPQARSATDIYSFLSRSFSAKSSALDIVQIDVIWPGAFGPYLSDLRALGLGNDAKVHSKGIIANNTVDGKLVAMPFYGDYGILYYRTDLLTKYGYSAPPKTWAELTAMSKKIQAGEQASNPNFYGYVWQGNAYEGLTCDALEWFESNGAGGFIDNGKVTIDNPKAVATLNLAKSWIGDISPRGVTTYQEEEARTAFEAGNAAFMRNWPYAYSLGKKSAIGPNFDVTTLPRTGGNASVGTVGGWQLAVPKASKHQGAAAELLRWLTSPAMEKYNAIVYSQVPTIPSVAGDAAVVKVNPWLKPEIANVSRVTRPSRFLKTDYNKGSTIIFQGINQILNGGDTQSGLANMQTQLDRLLR